MAIIVTFLLGLGNFAWHTAVIQSGHRMISDVQPASLRIIRLISLSLEFMLLCLALYAVKSGHTAWVWAYTSYSAINGGAAWLIVSRRI